MNERPVSSAGRPSRALTITLVVSLGLHLAALTAVLLLLRTGAPVADGTETPTEVELVMEEHKGDLQPTGAPQRPSETPPAKQQAHDKAATTPAPPAETPVEAPPPTQDAAAEPAKAPVPPAADKAETAAAPDTPPPVPPAVKITLQGTDSPSDALAWGNRVIPAAPDAVFHNRPPVYPDEAALNGEQGTVVLLIHVSPAGVTAGVDVARSSGYVLLDRAARDAVARWRFLPAVKDGQPVASDMTMGFVFAFE
jgi:periplasmic protein TonB